VTQDLTTGNVSVDIGLTKHGFADGKFGQPVRLEYKAGEVLEGPIKKGKPTKTKDEFWVEEAEFTGGHPENVKFEDSTFNKFGKHESDFSEVEAFSKGKTKKVRLKQIESSQKEAEDLADHFSNYPKPDDFSSGGRVPLGGGGVLKGILALGKGAAKGEGKFTKSDVLLKMFENTIKGTKSANTKKRFTNFIKEIKGKPELANDPEVWGFFTKGLPKNQKLVVYGDDTVDFWTQSEFGPHNIKTTDKFMQKHPNLSRDEAVKIQNMEPEDQIFEMKRLETIRKRTTNATGGRVPLSAGGLAGLLGE